jgi:RimJ/RimL family protein N-acetyltransferase
MITFEKAQPHHAKTIFNWLSQPHMIEFWDNSQEHKDDISNFLQGRKTPAPYFKGIFSYWIGLKDAIPYAFILTSDMIKEDYPEFHKPHLATSGHTITLDFGIGNPDFLGQKLATPTLVAFMDFYRNDIDPHAATFLIDPSTTNPRAAHVYEKAGFQEVGRFMPESGAFTGEESLLMVKNFDC